MKWIAAALVLIGLAVLSTGAVITLATMDDTIATQPANAVDWEERGQHGDFWGGHIAATASLAGSFFFLAALLLQSQELGLQRREVARMAKVQKDQLDVQRDVHRASQRGSLHSRLRDLAEYRDRMIDRRDHYLDLFLNSNIPIPMARRIPEFLAICKREKWTSSCESLEKRVEMRLSEDSRKLAEYYIDAGFRAIQTRNYIEEQLANTDVETLESLAPIFLSNQ